MTASRLLPLRNTSTSCKDLGRWTILRTGTLTLTGADC
jgi:hypothetical protein